MSNQYTILKRGTTHTLVKCPFNYYMYIPNKEFKEDERYLDNLWSNNLYIVDVDKILINLVD